VAQGTCALFVGACAVAHGTREKFFFPFYLFFMYNTHIGSAIADH
jgi:hypothetical protein